MQGFTRTFAVTISQNGAKKRVTGFIRVSGLNTAEVIIRTTTTHLSVRTRTLGNRRRKDGHRSTLETTVADTDRVSIISLPLRVIRGVVSAETVDGNELAIFRAEGIKSGVSVFVRETPRACANIVYNINLVTVLLPAFISTTKVTFGTGRARTVTSVLIRIDIDLEKILMIIILPLVTNNIHALSTSTGDRVKVRVRSTAIRVQGALYTLALGGLFSIAKPGVLIGSNNFATNVITIRALRAVNTSVVALFGLAGARGAFVIRARINTVAEARKAERVANLIIMSTVLGGSGTRGRNGEIVTTGTVASPLSNIEANGFSVLLIITAIDNPVAQARVLRRPLFWFLENIALTRKDTLRQALRRRLASDLEDGTLFVELLGTFAIIDGGVAPGAARTFKLIGAINASTRVIGILDKNIRKTQSHADLIANVLRARNTSLITTCRPIRIFPIDRIEDGWELGEDGTRLEVFGKNNIGQGDRSRIVSTIVFGGTSLTSTRRPFDFLFRGKAIAINKCSVHCVDTEIFGTILASSVALPVTDIISLVHTTINDADIAHARNRFRLLSIRTNGLIFALKVAVLFAIGGRNVADVTVVLTVLAFTISGRHSQSQFGITTRELRRTAQGVVRGSVTSHAATAIIGKRVLRGVRIAISGQMGQVRFTTDFTTARGGIP